jgi:hypothetical protein
MMELIPDLPDHVVGVKASGRVTAADYEQVLIPAIEATLRNHEKVNCLYQIDGGFEGFDVGAVWDDTKTGLAHLFSWGRIACVSDVEWIRKSAKAFGFLWHGHIRVFGNDELEDALGWVKDQ